MKKIILSMLAVMVLSLLVVQAEVTYAGPYEQDTDQEMQEMSMPSDQPTESAQDADQEAGSVQGQTSPSDNQ